VFPLEFCEPNVLVFLGIVSQVQSYSGVEYRDSMVPAEGFLSRSGFLHAILTGMDVGQAIPVSPYMV